MPEVKLGDKHECYNCGAKFYDLGKKELVCPKCGANQKDQAKKGEPAAVSQTARKRRKTETTAEVDEDEEIEELEEDEEIEDVELEEDFDDDEDDEDEDDGKEDLD